jgi:hypothetical protein
MKKLTAAVFAAVLLSSAAAKASCYHFEKAPNDVYVCVHGDSFDDRKKAKAICDKGTGKDCGNVGSYSSSCHSNIDKCYDENGNAKRDLSGY